MEEGEKRKRGHEEKAMDTKMRVSYMKRKACIKKKAMELSTLCDIKVCSICLGPAGDVETWPENPKEVCAIIDMFRDKKKLEAGKSLKERADDGGFINGLSKDSLHDFYRKIDAKIKTVEERVAFLNSNRVKETYFLHRQECDNPWNSLATAPVTGYLDDCYAGSDTNDDDGGSLWDILNGSGMVMPEETQNTDFMGGECWGDGDEANNRYIQELSRFLLGDDSVEGGGASASVFQDPLPMHTFGDCDFIPPLTNVSTITLKKSLIA